MNKINFFLNGEPREGAENDTIMALLEAENLAGKRIAVEKNGEIVPRSQLGTTPIQAGDKIEIVVAVGGG